MPLYHPLAKLTTRQLLSRVFGLHQISSYMKLHDAAKQGNEDTVRQFIESFSELDGSDEDGRSALQLAANSGCSEVFSMLIEAGATTDGPLIPPVSKADFSFTCFRLIKYSFKGILFAWFASKLRFPIPSFILQNVRLLVSAQLIAMPALYSLSFLSVLRSHPLVFLNTQSTIEAMSNFKGNVEIMMILFLDSGTDLEEEDKELIWSHAVERGYTGVCQRLLRNGFLVDSLYVHCEYPDIVTGLLHACGASHKELVLLLLSNGADPTILDNHGRSCLHMASANPYTDHAGSIEECDAILQILVETSVVQHINIPQKEVNSEVSDTTLSSRHGWPLADACQDLRTIAVRILLEAGANPNLKTESGWTALHIVCRWHLPAAVEISRLLVQYGADVNAVSDLNWTPLGCAASIGQFVDLIDILVESGAQLESTAGDASSLQVAARHDVSGGEIVKYLVRKGADVNAVGGRFGSVLLATLQRPFSFFPNDDHSTTKFGDDPSPQIIEFLLEFLEYGLDLNLVPEGGRSPLEVAAERNLPQVVSFLLERGAKLPSFKGKAYDRGGLNQPEDTRLSRSVHQNILSQLYFYNHEVFSVLLDRGVSPDADAIGFDGESEMTVLGASCSSKSTDHLKTATLLLQHGADPNFQDMKGHFALQRAAYAVSIDHINMLVEHGASTEIDDHEYCSLLHSLCKGYAKNGGAESNFETFHRCFWFLSIRLPRGSVWRHDAAGRNCLHYLAEASTETRLFITVDQTLSKAKSPIMPILEDFLKLYGNPHPLERVPEYSLEVFLAPDLDGKLAFHIASQRGDRDFMDILVQHVRSLEVGDDWVEVSSEDIVLSLMLQPDKRGWNALHYAASEGRIIACQYILEYSNAEIATTITISGESAQDLANKNRHYGVAEYIASFMDGKAGNEDAMKKAENVFARLVTNPNNVVLEFSEEQLLEAIRVESERYLLRDV